ncbi:MAG: TIGR03905 family TSCPD domain-containing protein [Ruminococcaceae bacterium]|nr:TIGR03905 family TSCPD domain-containing protein [Oscillospiraceae bacterium]
MEYIYKTQGTCSSKIRVVLDGDIVREVSFTGGCHGNLQGVSKLVVGLTVDQVEERLRGIRCGFKSTSCPDQLAIAVRKAYEQSSAQ